MSFLSFLRGLVAITIIVIITPLASIYALFLLIILRVDEDTAQVVPCWWARVSMRLSGVKVKVDGLELLKPGKPYIFVANHSSQFDILAIQGSFPWSIRWLAKKELFKIPIFGPALRRSGSIPIDRASGRKAMKSLVEAARRISDGSSVVIFPEGTRSIDGILAPFKVGAVIIAIKAEVEVVPMAIIGSQAILPKGAMIPGGGEIQIKLGAPIATAGMKNNQKQELAQLLHDKVAEILDHVPQ